MKKLMWISAVLVLLSGCTTFQTTLNVPPSTVKDSFSAYVLYYNCGNKEVPVDVLRGMFRDAQVQAQQSGTQGDQSK